MNEDLNILLMRLVQENIQTNQQWSATAIQFLNTLGNAIKEDTEYMRQSISRIEEIIGRITDGRMDNRKPDEGNGLSEKAEQAVSTQERYPASFYFRHKFPQDAVAAGYYLLISEEGDQLQYQLFDQQWYPVRSGFLSDRTLDSIQAAMLISRMEGLTEYVRYEMLPERVITNTQEMVDKDVPESEQVEILQEKWSKEEETVENQEEIEEREGSTHEKGRGR